MEAEGLERRVERILAWSCSTLKRMLAQRTGAAKKVACRDKVSCSCIKTG